MQKRKFIAACFLTLSVALGLTTACTNSQSDNQSTIKSGNQSIKQTDNQSTAKFVGQLTVISGPENGVALLRSTRFR